MQCEQGDKAFAATRNASGIGFHYQPCAYATTTPPDSRRAVFRAKKALDGLTYDAVALEGNPFTFPEVKTLLEGITVGGHKIEDEQQVLNQAASWRELFRMVESNAFTIGKATAARLNGLAARGEALEWGVFRSGAVTIGGTTYEPPAHDRLDELYRQGELGLQEIPNPHERAMCVFLFCSLHQFFWDGNKRTGRLLMNGVLLSAGYDAITVPAAKRLEFNERMIEFYESKDATGMMGFLAGCSLDKSLTHARRLGSP